MAGVPQPDGPIRLCEVVVVPIDRRAEVVVPVLITHEVQQRVARRLIDRTWLVEVRRVRDHRADAPVVSKRFEAITERDQRTVGVAGDRDALSDRSVRRASDHRSR